MDLSAVQVDQYTFSCSICLEVLTNPTTIPCAHSFCMKCIEAHWDKKDEERVHSCPECGQKFTPRPVLKKNSILADLVANLKKTGLKPAASYQRIAKPEDVACDVCTGRKLKALLSCSSCLASFCEDHVQPHFGAVQLRKHKLVYPSKKFQNNIYSCHEEVMRRFSPTEHPCTCYLCPIDYDPVWAAADVADGQRELEASRRKVRNRTCDSKTVAAVLQEQVVGVDFSADKTDKTEQGTERTFNELTDVLHIRSAEIEKQIRAREHTEVSRLRGLQEKLEVEIVELKKKEAELQQLAQTEDNSEFLRNYYSMMKLAESGSSRKDSVM